LPDKDILLEKITNIKRCLKRIFDVTQLDPDTLEDYNIQDVYILNLQRAVQAAIDIAVHIVSSEGWGVTNKIRDNFSLLSDNKIITVDLADSLKKMVGFRNIAVHNYSQLDKEILKSILKGPLKDMEIYYTIVFKKYC